MARQPRPEDLVAPLLWLAAVVPAAISVSSWLATLSVLVVGTLIVAVVHHLARYPPVDGLVPWARHYWCYYGPPEYDTVEETKSSGPDGWQKRWVCDRCGQTVHRLSKMEVTDGGEQ
jgi:hypothetical protein